MTYDAHDDDPSPDRARRALRWSLQALARAGSGQKPLFPEQAVSPGELASSFEQAAAIAREDVVDEVTERQRAALDAISRRFEMLTRDEAEFGVELWTEAAVATSEPWNEVRRLASDALDAFGWSAPDGPAEEPDPG